MQDAIGLFISAYFKYIIGLIPFSDRSAAEIAAEKQWLRDEQVRLETWSLTHKKALTLQARIIAYHDEWLVFVTTEFRQR